MFARKQTLLLDTLEVSAGISRIQFSTYYNDQKSTDSPVIHRLPDSNPYFFHCFLILFLQNEIRIIFIFVENFFLPCEQ